MRVQGSRLGGVERRSIAESITGKKLGGDVTGAATGRCPSAPKFSMSNGPLWNGWGPSETNTRFQPASQAGITVGQVPQLTLKWALGFPAATSAWAQPSLA